MTDRPVLLEERRGGVEILTLNRPERRNAVDARLATELGEALQRADDDDRVLAIVVTGAGSAFSAGADLAELAAGRSVLPRGHPEWGFAGLTRHRLRTPLIAAVNGSAMGGGTEIVLACDLAVAVEGSRFGLPEVRRGLVASSGGLVRLPRQIPFKRALELGLTGRALDAAEALELGLVNAVVPQAGLLGEAIGIAEQIAANAPLSVSWTRHVMYESVSRGADAWSENDAAARSILAAPDAREGAVAFAEHRQPRWSGSGTLPRRPVVGEGPRNE